MVRTIRVATLFAALNFAALASCDTGDSQPTAPDNSTVCCECGCSAGDGQLCVSLTVEGTQSASCDDLCERSCGGQEGCDVAEIVEICATPLPDDTKGDIPGTGCNALRDGDQQPCDPNRRHDP